MTKQNAGYAPRKICDKLKLFDWMLSLFMTSSEYERWVHPGLSDIATMLTLEVHSGHGGLRADAIYPQILFDSFMGEASRVKMPSELALLAYDV